MANGGTHSDIQNPVITLALPRHAVVGFNFSFGYKGAGNPELLRELGGHYGIEVTVMEPCCADGEVVSSSAFLPECSPQILQVTR